MSRRPHRRDPEGHRLAILDAARESFGEKGFAGATVRDIAGRAGVTHGLVLRQFGTKEQLFLAAVPGHRELDRTIPGDRETLPERVAAAFVERMERNAAGDPLVVLLRSIAADQSVTAGLLEAMATNSLEAYSQVLGDTVPDVPARVAMLGAQLIGITVVRYIAPTGPLARMPADELTHHLTRVLRQILLAD
ncbi:TetR family transcriptional regulator [Actinoplanes couchii]|uniref:TetR family transcriptional regulator n=1 Tax=Actinoplanes couchii TaxID=403638 RepID=A0ABQ3XN80_9ACTN|nr:TetR family transcriptional regulator [Actinoplanes couchii]MDR6318154.1 AcrR family transcriptional regulator [Actinoplanes couchii]GID59930.1 TetR family transcriptional regulator [Actinoplanes couchii]